jgi:hypothetical protein
MMDEFIANIYEITVAMNRTLIEENFEEFEKLLNDRNTLMNRVDVMRVDNPNFQYTQKERDLLEDSLRLDQSLNPLLNKNLAKTLTFLNQLKKKKQVSKKYHPHIKQTNGVFIDAKK